MNEDQLRKLIQSVKIDEPKPSFSDDLMKTIQAEEDLSLSPEVQRLLKNNLLAAPSDEFTAAVMTRLPTTKPFVFSPIINSHTWRWIAGLVASVVLIVVGTASTHHTTAHSYFSGLRLASFLGSIENAFFVITILGSICLLLYGDYWFRYKRSNYPFW